MKDLDNLVEDIYDVVYNEKQLDPDLIEDFGERV